MQFYAEVNVVMLHKLIKNDAPVNHKDVFVCAYGFLVAVLGTQAILFTTLQPL